ncbi:MAG: cytochrome-c oxidase, cbb3-type subunit I [Verrucomicrobiota bacterium]|nr:cytochrome-c oxidase, cbb3-type subunit I [Verrucomicrobiota bacterium]
MSDAKVTIEYNDRIVRQFMIASIIWGAVGMGAGVLIALMLNFWRMDGGIYINWGGKEVLSLPLEWLSFGRLRPLHTNAAIFAFVGNMMFAGIYYSTQRLCKARLASDFLSNLHFWAWQLIIVAAAVTLPLGLTRGKEYAELIWPINIAVTLVWVVFAVNFFWTLVKRNEPTLYVAIWFYIATIITVAMLYIVNHLSIPTSFLHSYPVFGGVQDALVQWWYGHNAVAFFLTTPILGIMYYFLPKAAERPVYSYRLSVVHFWSLVFIYIWAGPHHLLNTALPHWLQALGMLFSLMLWAPSWGGMLNGLLTLRGAWHKVRTDPVLKFFAAGVTFYGMATFEGPLMAIRSVNYLSHYSDWTIGHVHSGTLGWNGFMAAGMFYWLAPRLWKTKLYSVQMANLHFWIGLVGILFYIAAMWASGITQGLMLNATTGAGKLLTYPNFLDSLNAIRIDMLFRVLGGGMYLVGWFMLIYNIWMTVRGKETVNGSITVSPLERKETRAIEGSISIVGGFFNAPVIYSILLIGTSAGWLFGNGLISMVSLFTLVAVVLVALVHFKASGAKWSMWYDRLIGNWIPFTVLTFLAAAIGGAIQIIPTVTLQRAHNIEDRLQIPYTPLELAGRDIYIAEGCYNCHSQMIRTIEPDVLRYGDYSRIGESIYDHPFQWGSKRTGPDLAREGGKRPNNWHYEHMLNPRSTSEGSNMPNYPWLLTKKTDIDALPAKINVQRLLGVPYPESLTPEVIKAQALEQGKLISASLAKDYKSADPDSQLVAIIAYLQKLGASEPVKKTDGAK